MDQFELLTSVDRLPEGCDPSTVLCTLSGPFADYSKPTGNGYWYSEELFDKMLSSPQYKEFMSNGVNFAEGDHPSDAENRSSIYLPKVSHAYRDVILDRANKRVMGKIDILDTPDGRVLYTLIRYGAKLGVSSRGEGDLIVRSPDGTKIVTMYNDDGCLVKVDNYGNERPVSPQDRLEVDPDTYLFYAWDIVHQPSNEKARMDLLVDRKKPETLKESNHKSTLIPLFESLKGNRQALQEASKVVLKSDLKDKSEITTKLNEYVEMLSGSESNNDQSLLIRQLQNDLKESASQYLKLQEEYNKLKTEFDLINELKSALYNINNPVQRELEPLIGLTDESQDVQTLVESQGEDILFRLEEMYTNLVTPIYSILNNLKKVTQTRQDERDIARQYYDRVVTQYTGLTKSIEAIQVPETIKVDQNSISYLSAQYDQIMSKVSELELALHTLTESQKSSQFQSSFKKVAENRKYLELRCSQLGLNPRKIEAKNPEISTLSLDEIDEALSDIYGQSQYTIGPILPDPKVNESKVSSQLSSRGKTPSHVNESLMRVIKGNGDWGSDN